MSVKINIPINLYCTHSYRSDEPYGDWSETYDFSVGSTARITDKDSWSNHTETYEGELNSGDVIYAIIAHYSTGDSFGGSDGGSVEICSLHKDVEVAKTNLAILNADNDKYSATIKLDDGTETSAYRPWNGYFESLDSIEIYPLIVV